MIQLANMHARFEGPGVRFFASDNDDAEPMRGSAHMLELADRGRAVDVIVRRRSASMTE